MEFDGSIVNHFAQLLRQIYIRTEVKNYNGNDDYNLKLSKKFGLDSCYDHTIIDSFIFLLEDTDCAIQDFIDFGLDGHTRHNNVGERYLRLYGFLNAVYLQHSVPVQLAEVFKLGNKKKQISEALNRTRIIKFRAIAGSHTVNHFDQKFFRLSQMTLNGNGDQIRFIGKDESDTINLRLELFEYYKIIFPLLLEIFELIIDKLFAKQSKNFKELNEYLSLIGKETKGALLSKLPDDSLLIVSGDMDDTLLMLRYFRNR